MFSDSFRMHLMKLKQVLITSADRNEKLFVKEDKILCYKHSQVNKHEVEWLFVFAARDFVQAEQTVPFTYDENYKPYIKSSSSLLAEMQPCIDLLIANTRKVQ